MNKSYFGLIMVLFLLFSNGSLPGQDQCDMSGVDKETVPGGFSLRQNYPNPFNPSTAIEFAVPLSGQYTLKVFNMLGQEVSTLLERDIPPGYHKAVFGGSKVPSGIYIYRLSGNNVHLIKKMVLAK